MGCNVKTIKELDAENKRWYNVKEKWSFVLKTNDVNTAIFLRTLNNIFIDHHYRFILNSKPITIAVRSADGLTSIIIYIICSNRSYGYSITESNEIEKEASRMPIIVLKYLIHNVSGERIKSTLMFKMTTIESADLCVVAPRADSSVRVQIPALNYLAIPGIKNTVTADTVVLMPMTIYDKVWSLVCRHPARSSFNEGLSQQSQSGIFFVPYHHDMLVPSRVARRLSGKIFVSLNPESSAVAPMKLQPQATPPGVA
ncbi:hypothetical protein T10_11601 [Trichinella papuae]|uniref:Uncharacterized protein n=1 Tax=Trichinella papuae TaxID=268474 RepID=A0A0V1MGM8_9BILA|nr:hypothetical protein T10_11601 [Trichinella papuae]